MSGNKAEEVNNAAAEEAVLETLVTVIKRARDTEGKEEAEEEKARGDKKQASEDGEDGARITITFARKKQEDDKDGEKDEDRGGDGRAGFMDVIVAMQASQMIQAHSLKMLKIKKSKPFQTFVHLRSMARTFGKIADTRGSKSRADKVILDFFEGSGTLLARIDRIYKACEKAVAARNAQAIDQAKAAYEEYTTLFDKYTCPEHPHFETLHGRFVKGWSIVLEEVVSQATLN
jgi:hypothetical protein